MCDSRVLARVLASRFMRVRTARPPARTVYLRTTRRPAGSGRMVAEARDMKPAILDSYWSIFFPDSNVFTIASRFFRFKSSGACTAALLACSNAFGTSPLAA